MGTLAIFFQLLFLGIIWGLLNALIANGLNIIYGVMGILNLAHGTFLMVGAYLTFWLFELWHISPLWSLPLSMLLLVLIGIILQTVVVNPIVRANPSKEAIETNSLIAFFGVLMLIENIALLLFSPDYRSVDYLNNPVHFLGVSLSLNKLVVFVVSLVLNLFLMLFMTRTWTGKAMRAVTQNREASVLLAINPKYMGYLAFIMGSALCGAGGALASMLFVTTPTMGFPFLIKAFTVMVIGGQGNITGTFVAGIVLGVVESLSGFVIGESYKEAVDYMILLPFLFLVSKGYIFKRRVV
jgi:branched-chain amino acid transport system permease protein